MKRYFSPRFYGSHFVITICLLFILLPGCAISPEETTASETHSAVILSESTQSIGEATPGQEMTDIPTNLSEDTCQFEIQEKENDLYLSNSLVYLTEDGGWLFKSDQFGNFQRWVLPTRNATFNAISPDGDWLVYRRDDELVVTSVDSSEEIVYPWQTTWTELWGWVSPEKISIRYEREQDTDLLVIFSPFSNPPNIEILELSWQFIPEFNNPVFYSPDFSLVLYPNNLSIAAATVYSATIVWEKPIEQSAIATLGTGASWSPDGQFVALGLPVSEAADGLANELTILTRDGSMVFQTNYHKSHTAFTIRSPRWSPNGQYLSFWLIIPDTKNYSLQIYDTLASEFLDICILQNSPGGSRWSLDSQQIAYLTDLNDLLVYDLPSQRVFLLAEKVLRLIGWVSQGR